MDAPFLSIPFSRAHSTQIYELNLAPLGIISPSSSSLISETELTSVFLLLSQKVRVGPKRVTLVDYSDQLLETGKKLFGEGIYLS